MEPLTEADPERIGAHVLVARLGAGGMGQVYLGRSPGGRLVAVKVVRGEIVGHPEALARFRREVETVRAVRSAYTASLIDASLEEAPYWLATEYVAGPTLAAAVRTAGPFGSGTCRGVGAALAEGLASVHAYGVTHRDLKPQNVILGAQGPQLIDFGIARGVGATALTQGGQAPGTPGFTAPEVLLGAVAGDAADVFALGATLAFAATGRPPYGGGPAAGVGYRTVHEPVDVAGVEAGLAAVIEACVRKDPAERPGLAEVIRRCAVGGALVDDPGYAAVALRGAGPGVVGGSGGVVGAWEGDTVPVPASGAVAAPGSGGARAGAVADGGEAVPVPGGSGGSAAADTVPGLVAGGGEGAVRGGGAGAGAVFVSGGAGHFGGVAAEGAAAVDAAPGGGSGSVPAGDAQGCDGAPAAAAGGATGVRRIEGRRRVVWPAESPARSDGRSVPDGSDRGSGVGTAAPGVPEPARTGGETTAPVDGRSGGAALRGRDADPRAGRASSPEEPVRPGGGSQAPGGAGPTGSLRSGGAGGPGAVVPEGEGGGGGASGRSGAAAARESASERAVAPEPGVRGAPGGSGAARPVGGGRPAAARIPRRRRIVWPVEPSAEGGRPGAVTGSAAFGAAGQQVRDGAPGASATGSRGRSGSLVTGPAVPAAGESAAGTAGTAVAGTGTGRRAGWRRGWAWVVVGGVCVAAGVVGARVLGLGSGEAAEGSAGGPEARVSGSARPGGPAGGGKGPGTGSDAGGVNGDGSGKGSGGGSGKGVVDYRWKLSSDPVMAGYGAGECDRPVDGDAPGAGIETQTTTTRTNGVAGRTVKVRMRATPGPEGAARPAPYPVTVVVKPPGARQAPTGGPAGFASSPVDLYATWDSGAYGELTYPDDFAGAVPLASDRGDWTVVFYRVEDGKDGARKFTGISCGGFRVG
ncbi:hypothetical protein GCM10010371_08980 [Streptomyces subrutilus]|uniref:Protein kinase domain-containing protein n=1 Tax=Streptomyces subrutilus TaxID=36818 RepID=A0A918QIV0_9ACTN|nr:serine/threonine-protein kinase [Streptomyces subrutilus]GGZ51456.1 hypothetical protein GCM10010371_08980 [Streptomyces subrutilus]